MAPVVLATELLEVFLQQGAHGDDAVCHILHLTQPLFVQSRVVQDLGSDARAVNRRIGVERPHEDLDLRVDTLLLLDGFANNRKGTNTFAVETLDPLAASLALVVDSTYHVLGEALSEHRTETLLDEMAQSKCILVCVAAGEALVGHVEEGEVLALFHGVRNLHPLVLGRVNASRVVGTSME